MSALEIWIYGKLQGSHLRGSFMRCCGTVLDAVVVE
jgi:hypothetical protein